MSEGEASVGLDEIQRPIETSLGPLKRYIPGLFHYDDSPEATGLAMDQFARGAVTMSSMFLGPALLQLAKDAAKVDCADDAFDCDEEGKVYGMKPTSLLSNIAVISGFVSSILLPLFGAVVDHTPHRRAVGAISAAMLAAVKGVEIFVGRKTWFAVALLQVASGILFNAHLCATFAYTSELSEHPAEQTRYNASFNLILYVSTLLFLVSVSILAALLGTGDVGTARVSQIETLAICVLFFGYAWTHLFPNRPALSQVHGNSSLFSCGVRKIAATSSKIWTSMPSLKWFMLSVIMSESAASALVTVATTYMSHFLEMDSLEIAATFLVVILSGIPGTWLAERVGLFLNPLTSVKLCLVLFILTTAAAAIFVRGPESKNLVFFIGSFWGVGLGWLYPTNISIFITISPRGGQETELMAIYIFCGTVLSWLPPLLFTFLNELGVDMGVGMASLDVFFAAGLAFLLLIGNYGRALEYARLSSQLEGSEEGGGDVESCIGPATASHANFRLPLAAPI